MRNGVRFINSNMIINLAALQSMDCSIVEEKKRFAMDNNLYNTE